MEKISFNELPEAIEKLIITVSNIEALLQNQSFKSEEKDLLLTVEQAAQFLNLSVSTLYGFTGRAAIPFCKVGKRLYFSKKELLNWIKSGRKKTVKEMQAETDTFLANSKKS